MQQIRAASHIDSLAVKSNDAPVLLFKHSSACGSSADARDEVERFAELPEARGVAIAQVLVIEDRPLSDAITERFGVRHESPQAILLRNGEVSWHASHRAITRESLRDALKS